MSHHLMNGRRITEQELETLKRSYAEEGYAIVRNVVPKDRLEQLRKHILEEFARTKKSGELFAAGGSIVGHLNCFPGQESRFAYDALVECGIVAAIQSLFPRPLPVLKVNSNLNLPKSVAQHYHVDGAFMQEFIECNVAVVDTDSSNGAMEVAPGTQKKFYKYWQFALERPYKNSRRVFLKQGDILIRTSNLWHRGMPNMSDSPRPMLSFVWQDGRDGTNPKDDPFAEDGGKIVFKKNWYRTDRFGQMREWAYVAAPSIYFAYSFVRSLFDDRGYTSY